MSRSLLEKLEGISTSLYEADSRENLFEALNSGCIALGFDIFTLSCHKPSGREMFLDPTFTTLSATFLTDYDRLGWYDDDAMAARLVAGEPPYVWNTERDGLPKFGKQSYIDFLQANRLSSGVSSPIAHLPGTVSMFVLTSINARNHGRNEISAALIMANAAMAKAEMLGLCPQISSDHAHALYALSERQFEILKWIGEGKSNTDIATIMDLNYRAVRFHVSQILKKLGVASRSQAAAVYRSGTRSILVVT